MAHLPLPADLHETVSRPYPCGLAAAIRMINRGYRPLEQLTAAQWSDLQVALSTVSPQGEIWLRGRLKDGESLAGHPQGRSLVVRRALSGRTEFETVSATAAAICSAGGPRAVFVETVREMPGVYAPVPVGACHVLMPGGDRRWASGAYADAEPLPAEIGLTGWHHGRTLWLERSGPLTDPAFRAKLAAAVAVASPTSGRQNAAHVQWRSVCHLVDRGRRGVLRDPSIDLALDLERRPEVAAVSWAGPGSPVAALLQPLVMDAGSRRVLARHVALSIALGQVGMNVTDEAFTARGHLISFVPRSMDIACILDEVRERAARPDPAIAWSADLPDTELPVGFQTDAEAGDAVEMLLG